MVKKHANRLNKHFLKKLSDFIKVDQILVFTGGSALSIAVQVVSMVDLTSKSICQVIIEDFIRLLLSGIIGALLFLILYYLVRKIKSEKTKEVVISILKSFNLFWFYVALQGNKESLIYYFIALVALTGFIIGFSKRGNDPTLLYSKAKINQLILTTLIFSYFAITVFIYQGDGNFYSITRAILSTSYLAIPIYFLGRFTKAYLILISFVLALHALPPLFHQYMFNQRIDQSVYYAILEAPFNESLEYISSYLNLNVILLFIAYMALPFFLITRKKSNRIKPLDLKWLLIPIFSTLLIVSFGNKNYQYNVLYGLYQNLESYKVEYKLYNDALDKRKKRNVIFEDLVVNGPEKATYVFVIGESTGRNHLGLYGYHRNTNPKLSEIKNELLIYTDVISPHSHTKLSLSKILSFGNHEDMKPFYNEGTMIELFNAAGFKTYWISNQQLLGSHESVISTISSESDYTNYVNRPNEFDNGSKSYDSKVLNPFKKALAGLEEKKFIIVHLLGTHGDYTNRYPKEFDHYKEGQTGDIKTDHRPFISKNTFAKDIINKYDNAILYNDMIISELIKSLKSKNDYGYLIYLSDHGEEVYDSRPYFSHQESNATPFMFETPFIVWFSSSYRSGNQTDLTNYYNSQNRAYQTDDFIYSILDLSHITFKHFKPSKSIFNPNFQPEKRMISKLDYDSLVVSYNEFKKDLMIGEGE